MADRNDVGMAIGLAGIAAFGTMMIVFMIKIAIQMVIMVISFAEIGKIQKRQDAEKLKASEAAAQKASSSTVVPFSRRPPSFGSPPASFE